LEVRGYAPPNATFRSSSGAKRGRGKKIGVRLGRNDVMIAATTGATSEK
jgi:hypothetical protein